MEKDFVINENENSATWVYEYSMWKNPGIFITVAKVLLISALMPVLVVFFTTIGDDGFLEALKTGVKVYGVVAGVIIGLLLLTYPIVTILKGGKYIVVFEMDEKGINHCQMEKQFRHAQALSLIGMWVGVLSKNHGTFNSNLLASTHQATYSSFKKVRQIIVERKRNTIKLIGAGSYNEIYIGDKNFDYVLSQIIKLCSEKPVVKGV